MALSIPFWALIILHFGNLWGLFFLMTAGPNFMSSVLGFTLGHTGIVAAFPYLARLIFGCIFGQVGDVIIRKNWMTKIAIRKTFILFCKYKNFFSIKVKFYCTPGSNGSYYQLPYFKCPYADF